MKLEFFKKGNFLQFFFFSFYKILKIILKLTNARNWCKEVHCVILHYLDVMLKTSKPVVSNGTLRIVMQHFYYFFCVGSRVVCIRSQKGQLANVGTIPVC